MTIRTTSFPQFALLVISIHAQLVPEVIKQCPQFLPEAYSPACVLYHSENCEPFQVNITVLPERFVGIDDPTEQMGLAARVDTIWGMPCPNYTLIRGVPTDHYHCYRIPEDYHVWLPDLVHSNAVADFGMTDFKKRLFLEFYSDSNLVQFWLEKHGIIKSVCAEFDYTYFPFDHQLCAVEFMLLGDPTKIGFVAPGQPGTPDKSFFHSSFGWTLLNFTPKYVRSMRNDHPTATFLFYMKRNPQVYMFSAMLPCFLLSSLQVASFAIPAADHDRIIFNVTILLALTFLQGNVLQLVPAKPQWAFLKTYVDVAEMLSWFCTCHGIANFALLERMPETMTRHRTTVVEVDFRNLALSKTISTTATRVLEGVGLLMAVAIFIADQIYAAHVVQNYFHVGDGAPIPDSAQ